MIQCSNLRKTYRKGRVEIHALDGVNLGVTQGEFVVIRGPSGSGKSTLLFTIGGMLHPTSGTVEVTGVNLAAMRGSALARFRANHIGFVFQMFHLVPYLTVLENVLLAAKTPHRGGTMERAKSLLEHLGLIHRLKHLPYELSAGEQQRVAIARALLNQPLLLLADEPTGNLDPQNAEEVMRHMKDFHDSGGTVLIVTHEKELPIKGNRVLELSEGIIHKDMDMDMAQRRDNVTL